MDLMFKIKCPAVLACVCIPLIVNAHTKYLKYSQPSAEFLLHYSTTRCECEKALCVFTVVHRELVVD
jgi:hypothetical protein